MSVQGKGGGLSRHEPQGTWTMTYQDTTNFSPHRTHWQDWLNLILGVWLFFSPWILAFASPSGNGIAMAASWNAWVLGVAVFVVSLGSSYSNERWPEWINLVLGAWIFLAPWILGFQTVMMRAAWDHWIIGAAVFILAVWSASTVGMRGPQARV
jgi:hypothetical protein